MKQSIKKRTAAFALCMLMLFCSVSAVGLTAFAAVEDTLVSGKYVLTADSYPANAMMKMPAIITIDTSAKTFMTQDAREGKNLAPKGSGTYTFDDATGVYTVTYTADTRATSTTFTYADNAITFTSPMAFGIALMNITDDDGNFIPYTAKREILRGTYTATTHKTPMGNPATYESKVVFHEDGTFVYNVTLDIAANPDSEMFKEGYHSEETVNGTYNSVAGILTFADDGNNFDTGRVADEETVVMHGYISSFARMSGMEDITLKKVKFEDKLQSGKFILTEDSYDASAYMKMPAIITIDAEAKTFNTQDAREGKDLAPKGFGTYTFDEATGEYTVTYTADTKAVSTTFTYADDGITFTSPMGFGNAAMNVTDEDGNFLPYTAKAYTEPEEPAVIGAVKVTEKLTINARDSKEIEVTVEDNGAEYTLTYKSSNENVATVDKDGKVTAHKRGEAKITVTATDANGNTQEAVCTVTVKYTFVQWLIVILLFGWIWY